MVKIKEPFDPMKYAKRRTASKQEWLRLLQLPYITIKGRRVYFEKNQEIVTYYALDASNRSVAVWCD